MPERDKMSLSFNETLKGAVAKGELSDYREGMKQGKQAGQTIEMVVKIEIPRLRKFIDSPEHEAQLSGTVTYEPLAEDCAIYNGTFNLFAIDRKSGHRHMTYAFNFKTADDVEYYVNGYKDIFDNPGFDLFDDMTTLFTTVYRGQDATGVVYGKGEMLFNLWDAPKMFASLKVKGGWWGQRLAAKTEFLSFAYGALRDEYLREIRLTYDTGYRNLVLSGQGLDGAGDKRELFFVSGYHAEDFPWGDRESFTDVLLAVADDAGGYRRFALTDKALPKVRIDIKGGTYRYSGEIYELTAGHTVSMSEMRSANPVPGLKRLQAELEVDFEATRHDLAPFPFRIFGGLLDKASVAVRDALRKMLPSEHLLGIHILPHSVDVKSGTLKIIGDGGLELDIVPADTYGEAEVSLLRNVREPTLLYGYLCALDPKARQARVEIHSNSLRNEREYWAKDHIDSVIGSIVSHLSDKKLLVTKEKLRVVDLEEGADIADEESPDCLEIIGDPLIQINNDNYPTAVFERNVVLVEDEDGEQRLALQEDMDTLRREAKNMDPAAPAVTVAAVKDRNGTEALDKVLAETGFFELLRQKWQASGKDKADFLIALKPNFMFAYNKEDHTTFTNPKFVDHLTGLMAGKGYSNIRVVEAQSTYGQYFTKRSVREVAEYIGYTMDTTAGYEVVDMTEEAKGQPLYHFGPDLGDHPVAPTWKDADFRISFAKNKTHAYAYYTLTLKNIYGALPLGNKFKEYHCDRDIYKTTMDFLTAFPVDFGLVDAHTSADGPFGIFADSEPNMTYTIMGGSNLVAIDWVGATKMGLDPMCSRYMQLAVERFGKPKIKLIGSAATWKPWLNVPKALTLFTHHGLDSNHYIGNIFYMTGAYMDRDHFELKNEDEMLVAARALLRPIQEAVFLQAGGERSRLNNFVGKLEQWLGR